MGRSSILNDKKKDSSVSIIFSDHQVFAESHICKCVCVCVCVCGVRMFTKKNPVI